MLLWAKKLNRNLEADFHKMCCVIIWKDSTSPFSNSDNVVYDYPFWRLQFKAALTEIQKNIQTQCRHFDGGTTNLESSCMTRHILWISASIVWFDFLARECDSLKFTLFFPYFFLFFVPFLTKRFVHLESSCMTRHIFWISASIVRFDFLTQEFESLNLYFFIYFSLFFSTP